MMDKLIVVFKLGNEEFGVDISSVSEIIRIPDITELPNTDTYVSGIMNLRGKVVLVIDLAKKLGFPKSEKSEVIIVKNRDGEVGVLVDTAREVLRINEGNLRPPTKLIQQKLNADHIMNVVIKDERLITLVDLAVACGYSKMLMEENSEGLEESVEKEEAKEEAREEPKEMDPKEEAREEPKGVEIKEEAQANEKSGEMPDIGAPDTIAPVIETAKPQDGPFENAAHEAPGVAKMVAGILPSHKDVDDHFYTHEGVGLKNVSELHNYIQCLDPGTFSSFVHQLKNDFYNWIRDTVNDRVLAGNIKFSTSKEDILYHIDRRLNGNGQSSQFHF